MSDLKHNTTDSELGLTTSPKNKNRQHIRTLLKEPMVLCSLLLIFLFFTIFGVYPLLQVLRVSVFGTEGVDFSFLAETLTEGTYWKTLWNSFRLGVFAALLSTIIGFVFAYAITRTEMKGKKLFHIVALLPIVSPPFVIALSVILLFGRNGIISHEIFGLTGTNVYGFTSLFFIQTLAFFPIAYLNLRGVLESIDASLEDAALNMGASRWRVFRTITFPLAIPGIFSALLLVFIKSLEDFGNPMVIGGSYDTLAVEAYMQIIGRYDMQSGAFLALALLLPSLTAFLVQKYWVSRKSYVTVTGKPSQSSIRISEKYIVYPLFAICSLLTFAILLFYGMVALGSVVKIWGVDYTFTLDNFAYVFNLGFDTMKNSLLLAILATPITGLLGMLIAYLLIRKQFIGKKAMEVITMLSFAVPGTVIGIGYILAFNTGPLVLTGTAIILIITFVVRNITVGIEAGQNSLRQVDPSIEEASRNLGATSFATFRKISLPLMKQALFSGIVWSFVKSMTSISSVIFLVSVDWNLLTVSILDQIENSNFGAAAAFSMVLICIILIAIGLMQFIVNRIGYKGGHR